MEIKLTTGIGCFLGISMHREMKKLEYPGPYFFGLFVRDFLIEFLTVNGTEFVFGFSGKEGHGTSIIHNTSKIVTRGKGCRLWRNYSISMITP